MKKPFIYICMEDTENNQTARKVQKFVEGMSEHHEDLVFISPVHAFGYLKPKFGLEKIMEYRLELLDFCDCLLTFGDNSASETCMKEKAFAREHQITVWDMTSKCRLPDADELRIGG